jgi:hypothetical protein
MARPAPLALTLLAGLSLTLTCAPAAHAQPKDRQAFERKAQQLKITVDPSAKLQDRLFLKERTRPWQLDIEMRVPTPSSRTPAEFNTPEAAGRILSSDTTLWNTTQVGNAITRNVDRNTRLNWSKAQLFFPVPKSSVNALFSRRAFNVRYTLTGHQTTELTLDKATMIEGDAGERYLRLDLPEAKNADLNLRIKTGMICSDLIIDEETAQGLDWPKAWSGVAQSALKPVYLVDWLTDVKQADENGKLLDEFNKQALGGRDPKTMKPYEVVKLISAHALTALRTSNEWEIKGEGSYVLGFTYYPIDRVLDKNMRCPEDWAPFVLAAALRRAGVPARTVIGMDIEDKARDDGVFSANTKAKLHTWIEFMLADGAANQEAWVPLDINKQRKASSRAPAPNVPWRFVGNHEDMEYLIPVSYSLLPPSSAAVRLPNLWGWRVDPATPPVLAGLRISAASPSSREREPNQPTP